ncbi:argininosuccinate lyase [Saccharomonospora marina XMU15]|uniref:argininosuccinate lyase n=1 Tax=Saccharomonospora marina XMU15 TaxID=882083 RepID=H5X7R6_9PSEU|nr:lyase family protein [Saccharomonospora marina]EHR51359.1 argininosuccinate lyase [Saccharomonospora marina XMU15]
MSTHFTPPGTPDNQGLDTGRLHTALAPEAHRIVYDQYLPEAPGPGRDGLDEELRLISEVDRAHLVMLSERGIVSAPRAAALLTAIDGLRRADFAPIRDRPMPRGVYLAYESWLVAQLGEETGGVLHTGRSRNDLNATTARLRCRGYYAPLLEAVEELAEVLLDRAQEYRAVTMPAYTHGQPAVPITYGHYLAGLGHAVVRGLSGLLSAGDELDINPLGAGAIGGTSVAIDTQRTSRLLGFAGPARNSVDAVASRDFGLRLLSAAAVLGVALARAARDFSSWTSEEVALIRLGDDLVGSSSMMPQKRNPFLLEHIQGRATASLGAFTAAASAMATAPYSNAIAVSNEALRHVQPGLCGTADAVTLLRLVVAGAVPDADRMTARAVDGFTSATYLAEQLVASGVPFRSAHHLVGRTVLSALRNSDSLVEAAREVPEIARLAAADPSEEWLHPTPVAQACAYGGGPGTDSCAALRGELTALRAESAARIERWAAAARYLDEAVSGLIAGS